MSENSWVSLFGSVVSDHLLARLLILGPIRNSATELKLTSTRRDDLFADDAQMERLAYIAIQCFLNEYAWREQPEETARVEALWRVAAAGEASGDMLLRLACYRGLGDLPNAKTLLSGEWALPVRAVLRTQVADALEERRLRDDIEAMTDIREGLSQAVREMYEANPYPRWAEHAQAAPASLSNTVRKALPDIALDGLPDSPKVLVAGCGTGRHSIGRAANLANSQVLAVDLSRSSLSYALRKSREAGLQNVRYAQADILELPTVEPSYDLIEAAGILQCMDSPEEGLRALVNKLKSGGLIRLGLYSAIAREPLKPAMELGLNYPRTTEGIRDFRACIMDAPAGSPVRAAMEFADFYSTSTCRDLLLHVKEHVHTFPEIKALLDGAGLTFLGQDLSPSVRAAYRAMFPDDPTMTNLDHWDVFERANPATFARMYQVWARKP